MHRDRQALALAALLTALLLGAGCSRDEGAAPKARAALSGKLVITGSSTLAPVVAELGRQFQKIHPQVEITVQAGGSVRGLQDVRSGAAASAWSHAP